MNVEKVQASKATKYIISGLDDLDPIIVSLEDVAPKKGKLSISCSDESWTADLDNIGKDTDICDFVASSSNLFLTGKLANIRAWIDDFVHLKNHARALILIARRMGQLNRTEARECFDATALFSGEETPTETDQQIAKHIFGPEWCNIVPSLPNPNYRHLNQILSAVHEALLITKPQTH